MEEKIVSMNDGHKIFVRIYEPKHEPIGYIHILHGMAEHSGRYEAFCRLLQDNDYFVAIHDHRGHGKTSELNNSPLGFIADEDGFERLVEDVYKVMKEVKPSSKIPTFLFGHSMGSFVARRFSQEFPSEVDKLILCGTSSTSFLHIVGYYLARLFSKVQGKRVENPFFNDLSFGAFNKNFPNPRTSFDWLCSDESVVDAYIEDPYCGFIPTNQFFVDLTGGLRIISQDKEIKKMRTDLPILMISGNEDPVGDEGDGVFEVANQFEKLGLTNVVVHLFIDMRHEILNEVKKEKVHEVILRWLSDDALRVE